MSRRTRLRFRPRLSLLVAVAGGFLLGAGFILVRVGEKLDEVPAPFRWLTPAGGGAVVDGVVAISAGVVLVALAGLTRRRS
jgi:hypothetical protein